MIRLFTSISPLATSLRISLVGMLGILGLLALSPSVAQAGDGDIALARFRTASDDPDFDLSANPANIPCRPTLGVDGMGRDSYREHSGCWARQMAELGGSVIPIVLSPARTVGYGGFELAFEGWVTGVSGNGNAWRLGTEGDVDAGGDTCVDQDDPTRPISTGIGCNRFASNTLFWSRLMARKAFPFGFQLGTGFSYLLGTNLFAWSLEVHWAILEGFRTGVGGWFPDIAVRAAVNTLVGDSEFNMTVPSIDVIISKPIVLGSTARLTPFAAWQMAFIFADSELVDLTPGTDAFAECAPDPSQPGTVCTGTGFDYENNQTFDSLRMTRQRLNFGLQFHYQLIQLTGSFAFDLLEPQDLSDDAPSDVVDTDGTVIPGVGRQWTVAFNAGLSFN